MGRHDAAWLECFPTPHIRRAIRAERWNQRLNPPAKYFLGTPSVVGLAFSGLQGDVQPHGIDEGVNLHRQFAPRTAHTTGSEVPFFPFAACW